MIHCARADGDYLGELETVPAGAVACLAPPVDDQGRLLAGFRWMGESWAEGSTDDLGLSTEPVIPAVVAATAAKLVLDDDGLYAEVESICLNHPATAVRIFWTTASRWERDNPYIAGIALELTQPLSEEQIDDMFRRAALKL